MDWAHDLSSDWDRPSYMHGGGSTVGVGAVAQWGVSLARAGWVPVPINAHAPAGCTLHPGSGVRGIGLE